MTARRPETDAEFVEAGVRQLPDSGYLHCRRIVDGGWHRGL